MYRDSGPGAEMDGVLRQSARLTEEGGEEAQHVPQAPERHPQVVDHVRILAMITAHTIPAHATPFTHK